MKILSVKFLCILVPLIYNNNGLVRGQPLNTLLPQPQIYIQDGNLYIAPAADRNLYLIANGTGKIRFNTVELNSLVDSVQTSKRDLDSFKRIFGVPSNSSSALSNRIGHLEQSFRRLDQIDDLDSRLTRVERTIAYNLTGATTQGGVSNRRLANRIRRLRVRFDAVETQVRSLGSSETNPCASNPCQHGGTCIPTIYGAFCQCPQGWEGNLCQTDQNECAMFAGSDLGCQNGATCVNLPGSYQCHCRSGFIGMHCAKRSGGCSSGPAWELCGHGTCVDQPSGTRPYACICEQGWKTNGVDPICNVDVDECNGPHASCSRNPRVQCINTPGSFHCGPCPAGYTGNGYYCDDINECLINNGGCSMSPMVQCINTMGSRTCGECPPGYIGNGITCQYVGMCQMNNGGCHPLARCVENPMIGQSFVQCICPAGYSGTGMGLHGCFPYSTGGVTPGGGTSGGTAVVPGTNACASNPCMHGSCIPNGNAFVCSCFPGYMGPTCSVRIDPCSSNPCSNGGTCVPTMSGFLCRCPNDFTGDLCEIQEESCGGTLAAVEGILTYPHSGSESYSHNANCVWTIQTTEGMALTLNFTNFHLEGSLRCNFDYLQINDGATADSPTIGRYCGTNLPNGGIINTTHNVVRLNFKSDGSQAGLGFSLSWNTTSPYCGGEITNQTHGAISSPGYPGPYPHNRDCVWTVSVGFGKRIQLVFASMRLETHPNCSYDYLQILDGLEENAHQLAIFCNTTLPPPLISTGPHLTFRFHSDMSDSDTGFHVTFAEIPGIPGCGGVVTAPSGVISSPHHPEPYAHALDCEWVIRLPPLETISIEFLSFQIERAHNCRYDYVEVREGNGPDGNLVGRYCGGVAPPPYRSVTNNLFVRFHSDESVAYGGFRMKYEAACGGIFTTQNVLRSPYYPGSYPKNRDCIYLISQPIGKAIRLDFIDFDIENGVGNDCLFDFLEIRDGDNENSTLIGHYCGANAPETIISTMNYLWIRFKTDGSVQNKGFMANFSTIDVGCGGIHRGERLGVIQSPRHPEVYPHGVTCRWIIRGEPGDVIRLTWASFNLEANARCMYDYIEVFDNSTAFPVGHTMGRFCGSTPPPIMTSSDSTITIVFASDHSVAHDGFMASYAVLNGSKVCGGNYLTQYGVLKSPNYPNRYPPRRTCTWTIKVPAGRQIRLNVTDFEMERGSSRGCIYDYLEIRNGGLETSPLIGKFCGSNLPPRIIPSFANALYLKFSSDVSMQYKGFNIEWDGTSTGCGGMISGTPQGAITSPNYPTHYGIRAECTWKITVNTGSIIQLTFVDLDIQDSLTCRGERVEIRDGINRNGKLLGKYCRADSVFVVNSTSNAVTIKYYSRFGGRGRGFDLRFVTVCNRVIEGFGSVIESPNFPRAYPHNRNCTWEIRAPLGNTVNISFSHFNIEGPVANNCTYDFVRVSERGRHTVNAPQVIGTYCGRNVPPLISSTNDTVFVNFVSDATLAFNGFRLEWVLSGCGGRLVGSWGRLSSPGYPRHYPASITCIWLITTELGTRVNLNVWDLDIEQSNTCNYDYLRVYGGEDDSSALVAEVCHKTTNRLQLQSHGNNMYVVFHSDFTITGKGFMATYSQIPGGCGARLTAPQGSIYSPNYPQNYDKDDDCGWLLSVDENHVVQLEFLDFDVEGHSNCSYDHVAAYDGASEAAPLLLMHCGNTLPQPPMIKASGNKMFVKFKTDGTAEGRGFKANYTTGCGARLTNRFGQISTLDTSRSVVANNNCTWIITGNSDEHVTLTFTFMDIHVYQGNGSCTSAYVEVLDGEDEDAPSIGRFCADTIPPALTSRSNSFVVRYLRGPAIGVGFRATYEISSSACGGNLASMRGSFTSPNYPAGYPLNAECVWNVRASPGNRVLLSFRQMSIESSDYCNNDFVEIHEESSSGRLLGHYCGNEIPANITAGNNLWVLFRSDGEGQAVGFWADYELQHGNELNGSSGQIASPLWPTTGLYSGDFFWRITVSEGMTIRIEFDEFQVGQSFVCSPASEFKIFDGYDDTAPLLLSVCGSTKPESVTSSGNVLYISFVKRYSYGLATFNLHWTEVPPVAQVAAPNSNYTGCGGNVTIRPGNTTTILSPNFPRGYYPNMRCEWTIFTDASHRLSLKVEDFDFEGSASCMYDKLEVYQGSTGEDYTLNQTLCRREVIGKEFVSTGRTVKLIMVTDASVQRAGFNITVGTKCGGIIVNTNGELGRLTSTNYGAGNYQHEICEWVVNVRPGRTIRVTFNDMNIYAPPSGGGCSTDSIVLRNGGHATSPVLGQGRYCGSTRPGNLETSGNQLYVKFTAYTNGGRGFSLTYQEVSVACGGQIHLTDEIPSYEFTTPQYPGIAPPFTECEWVFSVPSHEAVQIDFLLRFDITSSVDCSNAGVEIRDGGTRLSPLINKYCRDMPGTQKSTGNHLYLRYYNSIMEPGTGFKARASIARCGGTMVGWSGIITSPGYPSSYDVNLNCLWTIKGPEGSYISLRFNDINLNSGYNCSRDKIVVSERNISGVIQPREWSVCDAASSMIESSMNQVHIIFSSDGNPDGNKRGFKLTYRASVERCGGYLWAPSGFIQSPGYPRPYTHYRWCSWTINAPPGRRIRIEFLDFDLEEKIITATAQYCVDFVSVSQNIESYSYRAQSGLYGNERLCGSTLPPPVESTSSKIVVLFRSDGSVAHRGFKLKYTTDLPMICGGEIPADENSGSLASPNVTTNTPNTTTSAVCQWFKAGEANNVTTIVSVNRLYIPQPGQSDAAASVSCGSAGGYLRVSTMGYWAEPWKKFCGSVQNKKLYLPGNSFRADYMAMNQSSYFNMSYQVSPCGGRLGGPDNITSPNFPSTYPTNTECIWLLEFNWNSQIKITFTDIDLDDGQDADGCNRDYVVIRNGQYSTSPLVGKYCGTNLPQEIRSMSRFLFIEFHSDENSNGNRRGFRIQAEAIERGCGGSIHAKLGSLTSPRSTDANSRAGSSGTTRYYPHNTECEWIIESVTGYMLRFAFVNRFDLEMSANCSNDYVEILTENDGTWSSIGKFCGKQLPPTLNSTSTKAKVIFHTNEAVNGDGFRLNWYSACGGLYTAQQGEIRSAYFDKYEHSWGVSSFNYWSGMGRENLYAVQKCDYVIQGTSQNDYIVGEFMDPFHVSPHETYGVASLSDPALRCPIVNVSVWEGNDTRRSPGSSSRLAGGIYCGEELPPAFIATGAATITYNYLANLENYGFRLNYTIYQCGGLITEPTRISSPGHPFTSAPNMNCTWVIKAPRNKVVRLKLERLELEYHPNCNFDGLHLYDGPLINDTKKLASFCGNLTNDLRRLSSRSDSMTVQFITDYSVQLAGFAAAIDFTLGPQQNCGGKINLTSGASRTISTPDADNDGKYDSSLECNWLVIAADYQQIELSFNTFNLEGSRGQNNPDSCDYDYVETRDGPGPFSDVLGKFCSNRLPPRISSATNFMWITFVSDESYNYPGFRATVSSRQSPCGGSFVLNATQTPQYLTSPNYPGNYGNNVRCRYVVTGSGPYDEVDIRFIDVQIESSAECSKDSLRIRDVSTSYTSREGISGPVLFNGARDRDWRFAHVNIDTASLMQDVSYCGSLHPLPPDFISIGRSAEIIFETDGSTVNKGFKLMYLAAGCNRTYGGVQGRIFSPEWPTFSPLFSNCVFTINAPNGSVISIYFNEFLLPDSISCIQGAFEARENSESGRLLARYCGSALPNPIFSTTSTVWVQYFTKGTPARGYDITYTTTANGVGCGGDVFHTSGSITSPYYPGNYSRDADCRWRIRVPAALKLQFDFTNFLIQGDCEQNFVEVSSMDSHAPNDEPLLVARYCPGDTPSRYIGATDMAVVRYRTSVNNTGNGWRIIFRGVLPTQLPA